MMQNASLLRGQLEDRIRLRTSRRVKGLAIELEPERVIIRGSVHSFHLKQLAQQGIRDVLPHVMLENAITVDEFVAVTV